MRNVQFYPGSISTVDFVTTYTGENQFVHAIAVYNMEQYGASVRLDQDLGSVHGVDINPFAVAIARFRLLVAALKEAGVRTLADAARQVWRPVVGCTDSLRTPERQA